MISTKIGMRLALASALTAIVLPACASETTQAADIGIVTARLAAPPVQTGGVGWQQLFNVAVPAGKNLIYTDGCPDDAKVPVSASARIRPPKTVFS